MTETCDSMVYFDERDQAFYCQREKGHVGLHFLAAESNAVTHWENSRAITDQEGHFFMITWMD